jgi:T-complex protein 1 subunit beta
VSTFGNPEKVKLGSCKLIVEVMIGEDKVRRNWLGVGEYVLIKGVV